MKLKRKIIFFFTISASSGFFAVIGSILGGKLFGQTGLYIGAFVLGILSIVIIILRFRVIGWIDPLNTNRSIIGGVIGFLFAAVIAIYRSIYFKNPVGPVVSVLLTGTGTLIGHNGGTSK